jgi:hypothetical protein
MTADPMTGLHDHLGVLSVALAHWSGREDARDQAAARRAGSTAISSTDSMLADLHALRHASGAARSGRRITGQPA